LQLALVWLDRRWAVAAVVAEALQVPIRWSGKRQ